jgi:hypothetical protein
MPSRRRRPPFVPRLLGALLLLALLLLLLGLLFVDYRAALALVVGVGGAWLIVRIAGRLGRDRPGRRIVLAAAGVLIAVGVVIAIMAVPWLASVAGPPLPIPTQVEPQGVPAGEEAAVVREVAITDYRLTATPRKPLAAGVVVDEEIVFDVYEDGEIVLAGQGMHFPEREVASERRGFLLREVTVEPLGVGVFSPVSLTLPDGSVEQARLCSSRACPPAHVRLEDFPQNAFFAARGVPEVEIVPYINTEIVTWTEDDVTLLSQGVTFAYVPPPFQYLRPFLVPLIGASQFGEWLVGLVGLVGGVVAAPVLMPVLENLVMDRIFEGIKRVFTGKEEGKKSSRR